MPGLFEVLCALIKVQSEFTAVTYTWHNQRCERRRERERVHTNSSYIPLSKPGVDTLSNPSNSLCVAAETLGGSGRNAWKNCFTRVGPMKDILISLSIYLYNSEVGFPGSREPPSAIEGVPGGRAGVR